MIKIALVVLSLILSWTPDPARAETPADLAELKAAGLSEETISRWLAQNLEPGRLSPPPEAAVLAGLARRGGDDLAAAYLDKKTSSRPELSPEVIKALLAGGLAAEEFRKLFASAATAHQDQSLSIQLVPAAPSPPPPQFVKTPSRPKPGYQDLRPGQSADPSLRLPPPPVPFDIRRQKTDGAWLGVTEREMADGHLVEVHVNGSVRLLGQEAISRPTGHKIYRYYSGRPDAPRSGSDLLQEERNREELGIIFSRDRG